MILLDRVTKTYGKATKPALNRVSLHIHPKEFVILVGTSGAGKSTLLKTLAGQLAPQGGTVLLDGQGLEEYSPNARARKLYDSYVETDGHIRYRLQT